MDSLPFRQVHLDFHTSEHIPGVGAAFDPDAFADTLVAARVNSVTLFAKCHHGWSYYPTEIGRQHPHLTRPDLLGDMVEACRARGIATPVYLTVQWDELTARERPAWRAIPFRHRTLNEDLDTDMNQLDAVWHPLSLANEELVERIARQCVEVVERYDPEGLFMDILLEWEDVSQASLERMAARGLDPEREVDRQRNDREIVLEYYQRVSGAALGAKPSLRIFHNSGHLYKNERERWKRFTHLELESLPTGGWGYDHFPISARYANTLGLEYLGMTGKFHTSWGEFGGYKGPPALEYECALTVAMGGRCSVGDQLHPSGRIDAATYALIEPAYRRVERLEPYAAGAAPVSEIAVFSSEGHHSRRRRQRDNPSDEGACRMLLESQLMFDVIDQEATFEAYRLIVLPDDIQFEPGPLREKFLGFLDRGGKLLLTGRSGMDREARRFLLPVAARVTGEATHSPDYIEPDGKVYPGAVEAPLVMYERAMGVAAEGAETLARIREPYFNRSWRHFCSHQHAPYRLETSERRQAALQSGNAIYFAHPLCREYRKGGQPLVKRLFVDALLRLLGEPQVRAAMPSAGRLSLMRQEARRRSVLHLLFAQPQLRGEAASPFGGIKPIEIIEDIVPLHGVRAWLRLPARPARVYSAYGQEREIQWSYGEGTLEIEIPRLEIHEAVVVEEGREAESANH